MVRTGIVAMRRGNKSTAAEPSTDDLTELSSETDEEA
jgi:hypothetical protein